MPPVTIDGTSGITTPMYNGTITANAVTPSVNMKNRIINGAMTIDQRNAGASVTPTNGQYTLDRFVAIHTQASKFSVQQDAGAITPPAGFTDYLGVTSLSAYSIVSGDAFGIRQPIEGYNIADLGWGTANAKTVTLSFWVRSSLTGTFGGSVTNSVPNRSYPFSYTISAANTWEYKTITIAGDTSGTWLTTNNVGIYLNISIGTGSTFSGTAGSWAGVQYISATGATSVVGTNGATFYITGVQLEVGSTATSFDYRPYGTELALCQRYLPAFNGTSWMFMGQAGSSTINYVPITFPVSTRVAPTGITVSSASHFRSWSAAASDLTSTNVQFNRAGIYSGAIQVTFSSGLTAGDASGFFANNSSAQLLFTGCEL
jgi:hypothetical protein